MPMPQCPMNEDEFNSFIEKHGISEDSLIEAMVATGWTIGKEIDIHAAHYPYGNLYWPPDDDDQDS